jgi:hypothetical protein
MDEVSDDAPVAVVSLDMDVDGSTGAFAAFFDTTTSDLKERSLRDFIAPADTLQDAFDRLCNGELDYCTVLARPATNDACARPVVLHGAIVRLADATPCCVLYVAHGVPEVAVD